jgi:hypothetical protein
MVSAVHFGSLVCLSYIPIIFPESFLGLIFVAAGTPSLHQHHPQQVLARIWCITSCTTLSNIQPDSYDNWHLIICLLAICWREEKRAAPSCN